MSVERVVDHAIACGVATDMGDGDEWPRLHDAILASDILVVATPTWIGRPSYTETDHKHDWSQSTGRTMAANLVAVAAALTAQPIPPAG